MIKEHNIIFIFILCVLAGYILSPSFFVHQQGRLTGQVSGEDRSTLANLPWSHFEISKVTGFIQGDAYYGEAASESVFKAEAGKHGIIHIATHAFTDDESPSYSRLLFSNDEKDGEDGILYAYEIYNLRLNSELAVLSSCNTGTGKLIEGEGIFSLARAFMYAGLPSIIMSLWNVDDQSTAEIVVEFYERLSKGENKADALRNVKLDYLRKSDQLTANPVYWAGLVSIGDQSPVSIRTGTNLYLPVLILLLLGFTGYMLFVKFKKNRSARITD